MSRLLADEDQFELFGNGDSLIVKYEGDMLSISVRDPGYDNFSNMSEYTTFRVWAREISSLIEWIVRHPKYKESVKEMRRYYHMDGDR